MALQLAEDEILAGKNLIHTQVVPEPLIRPRRATKALNPETEEVTRPEAPPEAPGVP